jgi:hypothetical protein
MPTTGGNMFDQTTIAATIASWTALGIQLPKPLADKLEIFDEVRYVETAHAVAVSTAGLTTKNAETAVHELATRLLPSQSEPGKRSALDKAKGAILDRLASEIFTEASKALPEIIELLRPGFETAVSSFVESVENLPEPLTSEALVAAGPSVLSEYQTAREASQVIARLDSWLASVSQLPIYAGLKTSPALRVLSPSTRGELSKLMTAHGSHKADPVEIGLGTVYVTAAREGISFGLNTPADSAQIRETIESRLSVS